MSTSWLNKQRLVGGFVRFVRIGRRVFYDIADLDAALEHAKRRSTSETLPSEDELFDDRGTEQ
jgi:hypothetical protein